MARPTHLASEFTTAGRISLCSRVTSTRRSPNDYPVEREISDYVDFTGRTAAVDSVELRSRVWGYLDKVNFKEGAPDATAGSTS